MLHVVETVLSYQTRKYATLGEQKQTPDAEDTHDFLTLLLVGHLRVHSCVVLVVGRTKSDRRHIALPIVVHVDTAHHHEAIRALHHLIGG